MNDTIKVICENGFGELEVPMGTPLLEVAERLTPGLHPFLAAFVNNRIKELSYKIYAPVTIRFVDITSFAGIRVYQRTAWFLLQKAVKDLYPGQTLHIRHSMGQSGFYCEIDGIDELTPDEAAQLRDRMRELSVRNLPITRQRMLTTEVRARYAEEGFTDKIALLDTRPRLYSQLYTLDDTAGYFYGSLAPSTGYVTLFDIEPYYNGFYLALPLRTSPDTLHRNVHQEKMFGIFQEYQSWVRIMGVPTVGDVNSKVLAGDGGGLIKLAEAFHERKFAWVADTIYDAHLSRGARMVLISGPSSSGKTTSAHKLAEELERQGTPARVVSLDNFFRGAQYYPRLPDGTLDYENPDTLDLPLIRQCLKELSETGKTVLPVYDFSKEARSSETEEIDLKGGVCIVEGIHALNPELTSLVPGDQIYRVYAGLREEYCIDGRRTINTQDIRLCRRTLRDAATRGRSPAKTLAMWDRVMDGETRYIKGFKTTADFLLDTSFTYELGLIAKLLQKVRQQFTLEGHNAELWDETARRFEHVAPVALDLLPADSMLREFYAGEIGGKTAQ